MFHSFHIVLGLSHDLNVFGRMFLKHDISLPQDQMPSIEICSHVSGSRGEMKIWTFQWDFICQQLVW